MESLLTVDRLTIDRSGDGGRTVVRDLSFEVNRGEFVGLVGESGCGKTMTALAVMGLLPLPLTASVGRVGLGGVDLLQLDEAALRTVRGGRIGMIFQEPMAALSPVRTIGYQISEVVRCHRQLSRSAARAEAERLLDLVAMPEARTRLKEYPHQLSGGQRQRAMIAIALAGGPELLIADEPTTALDTTVQAEILDLLEGLRESLGLSVLLITHDLAVVAETCDRVLMMLDGMLVEQAPVGRFFSEPAHPHAKELVRLLPRLGHQNIELWCSVAEADGRRQFDKGCAFVGRCGDELEHCRSAEPAIHPAGPEHFVRCHLFEPLESRNG
jgi:peptide/nickel transport system ATP-binding protein